MMNAEDFYKEMKLALNYFDLSFGEKNHMDIRFDTSKVIFQHAGRKISVSLEEGPDNGAE